jgi:hypothetical protein
MGLLDLSHALVPGKVSPTRGDITAAIANAYINAPAPSIETLKKQYNVEFVMLAVAEVPVGADTIEIKIVGQDALGLFTVKRNFKVSDGIDETAMRSAAQLAFDAVQERWKITRAGGPQGGGGQTNPDQPAQAQGGGDAAALEVTAVYNGIKEWQAIRSKLQQLPGVLNWNLKSVNRESAVIGFDFPGGADRLATLGAQQGLAIENGPSGLIVKMR